MKNEFSPKRIEVSGKKVTVIGGGVIGASWTALFLANGMQVTLSDPQEGIENKVLKYIRNALPELKELGFNPKEVENKLHFEKNTATAVAHADYIQENGPEREDFKIALWQEIEKYVPQHTLFLSSSSGITATKQSVRLQQPERLLIGHPFNPPHLIPLVEVVPGEKTKSEAIQQAVDFYYSLGKQPQVIKKEVRSFVANRLQCAIFRECINLVTQGVVRIDELDNIVTHSLGIRWATGGPFLSFHLGGGEGGLAHFIEHLAPGMAVTWQEQLSAQVEYDEKTISLIKKQAEEVYSSMSIDSLAAIRDKKEIAIINALAKIK